MKKRVLSLFLSVLMVVTMLPVTAHAVSVDDSSVFLAQEYDYSCTLAAATVMLRRCAILRGDSNWAAITESAVSSSAWINGTGLRASFTYSGMTVNWIQSFTGTAAEKHNYLVSMLIQHPEGVVIYCRNLPQGQHAVVLTDYTNGTFYCTDTDSRYANRKDRRPLVQSTLGGYLNTTDQDYILEYVNTIWYVSSFSTPVQNQGDAFYAQIINTGIGRTAYETDTTGNVRSATKDNLLDPRQIWYFSRNSDGSYYIRNEYNGKYLEPASSTIANGTNVIVSNQSGGANQRWYITQRPTGYSIRAYNGNLFLSLAATNVQLATAGSDATQLCGPVQGTDLKNYAKPRKPDVPMVSVADAFAGESSTIKWSKSVEINAYDVRTYQLEIWDGNGTLLLSKAGLTSNSYNYTFEKEGNYLLQVTAVNEQYEDYYTDSGKTAIEVTSSHDHSYSYEMKKAPTTATNGSGQIVGTCDVCGRTLRIVMPRLTTADYSYSEIVPATCQNTGVERYTWNNTTYGIYSVDVTTPKADHTYSHETIPATCVTAAIEKYTCTVCGDTYTEKGTLGWSEWSTEKPEGISEDLIETATEYRYSDYSTTQSYQTSMPGYTVKSSQWVQKDTGSIAYVQSWPTGFYQGHWLYSAYNKTAPLAYETNTAKQVINSEYTSSHIYWHWCRGTYTAGPIDRKVSTEADGEFQTFHAFESTDTAAITSGIFQRMDKGDCCTDTYWYLELPITTRTYTTYNKLFTYEKWSDWSEWSQTPVTASSTRKVETRTVYRYYTELGSHSWDDGVVTTEPTCVLDGVRTYTCALCGAEKTGSIRKTGHTFRDGVCIYCSAVESMAALVVGTATASQGHEVMIPVELSKNTGFAAFDLEISYDENALTLREISAGSLITGREGFVFDLDERTASFTGTDDIFDSGSLLYLTFDVAQKAADGSYNVFVGLGESGITDADGQALEIRTEPGTVTVKEGFRVDTYFESVTLVDPDQVFVMTEGIDASSCKDGAFYYNPVGKFDAEVTVKLTENAREELGLESASLSKKWSDIYREVWFAHIFDSNPQADNWKLLDAEEHLYSCDLKVGNGYNSDMGEEEYLPLTVKIKLLPETQIKKVECLTPSVLLVQGCDTYYGMDADGNKLEFFELTEALDSERVKFRITLTDDSVITGTAYEISWETGIWPVVGTVPESEQIWKVGDGKEHSFTVYFGTERCIVPVTLSGPLVSGIKLANRDYLEQVFGMCVEPASSAVELEVTMTDAGAARYGFTTFVGTESQLKDALHEEFSFSWSPMDDEESIPVGKKYNLPVHLAGCHTTLPVKVVGGSRVPLTVENFPDANFREYLQTEFAGYIDADGNILTEAVQSIDCRGRKIKSMKGIELFKKLEGLNCGENQLATLDVSKNTALVDLSVYENQLTSLDVSRNVTLEYLDCYSNQLTSLDISTSKSLRILDCSDTALMTLDVSRNTKLEALYCSGNQLTELDVGQNTKLVRLSCGENLLTELDVSHNTKLEGLYCAENQLTSLDVSQNTQLEALYCGGNQLTELDVRSNLALTELDCSGNRLTKLLLPGMTVKLNAISRIAAAFAPATYADAAANGALEYLDCSWNKLTAVDTTTCPALETLICADNDAELTVNVADLSKVSLSTMGTEKVTVKEKGKAVSGRPASGTFSVDNAKLTLSDGSKTFKTIVVNGTYRFDVVTDGAYILTVEADEYVSRRIGVNVANGMITGMDGCVLRRLGDVTMDGTIDVYDLQRLYEHVSSINSLIDNYALQLADINGGGVDATDVQALYELLVG